MTKKDILNSFQEQVRKHRDLYEKLVTNWLKDAGMYDVDVVEKKTGKHGRLVVRPTGYSAIEYGIKFAAYTRDGSISKNPNNVDIFDFDEARKATLESLYEVAE